MTVVATRHTSGNLSVGSSAVLFNSGSQTDDADVRRSGAHSVKVTTILTVFSGAPLVTTLTWQWLGSNVGGGNALQNQLTPGVSVPSTDVHWLRLSELTNSFSMSIGPTTGTGAISYDVTIDVIRDDVGIVDPAVVAKIDAILAAVIRTFPAA